MVLRFDDRVGGKISLSTLCNKKKIDNEIRLLRYHMNQLEGWKRKILLGIVISSYVVERWVLTAVIIHLQKVKAKLLPILFKNAFQKLFLFVMPWTGGTLELREFFEYFYLVVECTVAV